MQVQLSDQVLCQYNLSGDLAIADGDELRFAEFEVFSDPGYSFIRWINIPPRLIKVAQEEVPNRRKVMLGQDL